MNQLQVVPSTIPSIPTVTTPQELKQDAEFALGKRMYWQGYSDGCCTTRAMTEGWYTACGEDDRGRDAYLRAMSMAADEGEPVDWDGVFEHVDIRHNSFGDRV